MARVLVRNLGKTDDDNVIINGTMNFAQRSTGLILQTLSAPQYTLDRWYVNRSIGVATAGQLAIQRSIDAPTIAQDPFGYTNSMFIGVNEIRTTVSTQFHQLGHVIEGNRFAKLINKKLVYQFWTKCNVAGVYPIVFNPPASTYKICTTYTDVGNSTWTKRQVALDMSSHPGVVATDTNGGLRISHWFYGSAATQGAPVNQWTNGSPSIPVSTLAFMNGLGTSFNITGTMLKEVTDGQYDTVLAGGTVDLEFTRAGRSYIEELQLCQRYYEKSYSVDTTPGGVNDFNGCVAHFITTGFSAAATRFYNSFQTPKRTAPLVRTINPVTGTLDRARNISGADTSTVTLEINDKGFICVSSSGIDGTGYFRYHWTAEVEL